MLRNTKKHDMSSPISEIAAEITQKKPKRVFTGEDAPALFRDSVAVEEMVNCFLVHDRTCSSASLATFLLVFSARKQEAHSLKLNEEGLIVGSLQKRGQNLAYPIVSCIDLEKCREVMTLWRTFEPAQITAAIGKLEGQCKSLGMGSCALLQETGAWLASKHEEDPVKRKSLCSQALRCSVPKPKVKRTTKRALRDLFKDADADLQSEILELVAKRQKV